MVICRQCCKDIESVAGKQARVFCSDKCRKAWGRANLGQATPDKPTPDTPVVATPDNKVVRDRVAQSLRDERQQGGATATPGERSSSTGDPRDTESGMERAIAASAKLVADEANTSQCYQDSGIPLPGDPGYRGVCALHHESKRWLLHPNRLRLTRAEMQKRHAHVRTTHATCRQGMASSTAATTTGSRQRSSVSVRTTSAGPCIDDGSPLRMPKPFLPGRAGWGQDVR